MPRHQPPRPATSDHGRLRRWLGDGATGSGPVVRLRLSGPEAGEGVTCSPADVQRILRALITVRRESEHPVPLWLGLITAFILAAGAGVSGAVWVTITTPRRRRPDAGADPDELPTCVAPQPVLPPTGSGPHLDETARTTAGTSCTQRTELLAPPLPQAPPRNSPRRRRTHRLSWGPNPVDAISGGDDRCGLTSPRSGCPPGTSCGSVNPNHTVQTPPLSAVARVGWLCPAGKPPARADARGARPADTDRARRRQPRAGRVRQGQPAPAGDLIVVRRANGTQVNFAVTQVAYADKDSFPPRRSTVPPTPRTAADHLWRPRSTRANAATPRM